MTSLVYFMKPKGKRGPIKIGCSGVPAGRLETFSAWSPWPLEIIGSVPGSFKDERFLHKSFADDHSHREWFKASHRLIACIKKIIDAGTIDAVRAELNPEGSIKKNLRRKRTNEEKLRISYKMRVSHCERRLRKDHKAWYAPEDVSDIIRKWDGSRDWDAKKREWVTIPAVTPTRAELARLDEYLADPVKHSVIPHWQLPRDPICIPHIEEAA